MARAIPVFPDVGSTKIVLPGVISPSFSADSIMLMPMRSFTDEDGFMLSSFTTIRARQPSAWGIRLSWTSGVLPMSWVISSAILMGGRHVG